MKKVLFTLIALLLVTTTAQAEPRFGIVGEANTGLGVIIVDDMYSAQVTYTSESDDATSANELAVIGIAANYKAALDSVTSLTFGVSYGIGSGEDEGTEYDTYTELAVVAGLERALSSNILMTTQIDLYSQKTEDDGTEVITTGLLNNARVGVAYLF